MIKDELYEPLVQQIHGSTNRAERKLGNNTYGRIEGDVAIVRLHSTDIVKVTPTTVEYNTGGWFTVTTKQRMNLYTPRAWVIGSKRGVWYMNRLDPVPGEDSWRRNSVEVSRFYDGITMADSDVGVTVVDPVLDDPEKPLRDSINAYARLYTDDRIAELVAQATERGTSGDCWFCLMFEPAGQGSNDHLLAHIDESYTMVSLALNALRERGYRYPEVILSRGRQDSTRRAIRDYMKKRLTNKVGKEAA